MVVSHDKGTQIIQNPIYYNSPMVLEFPGLFSSPDYIDIDYP